MPDCPLHVIEVDVSINAADLLNDSIWPEGLPRVDGVIICYDASDEDSFLPVEELLRKSFQTAKR